MGKAVDDMRGKPIIAVLQTFYEDNGGRMPNRAELRCMTYHSIVRGVAGVLYFSYHFGGPMKERDPQTWEDLKELAGEIRSLAPILLLNRHQIYSSKSIPRIALIPSCIPKRAFTM